MGTLPSCLKSKILTREGNSDYIVGTASMQGFRISQEDAHLVNFSLKNHPEFAFFGVFDGHGGSKASQFLKDKIMNELDKNEILDNKAIIETLLSLDKDFVEDTNSEYRDQGSTCIFCLIQKLESKDSDKKSYKVICVNVGDSRCILLRRNGNFESLSNDHKPSNKVEAKRIKDAGGYVVSNRVDGTLAVSRAFGDYNLKNVASLSQRCQKVIAEAEIIETIGEEGDYVLVCCDGIFENLQNEDVAKFTLQRLEAADKEDPAKVLSELFDYAEESGSSDNMTGVLLAFGDGSGIEKSSQFIPGPLFMRRDDKQFYNAYEEDAKKNGYEITPLIRFVAYHMDMMTIKKGRDDAVRKNILQEISKMDPWGVSLEDLAFLINSLNSALVISPADVEECKSKGVNTVTDLKKLFEESHMEKLSLNENIVKNISVVFSLWNSISQIEKDETLNK